MTDWIVCPDCHGEGKHALHGIALTESDRAEWSEDELEDYREGLYDTLCVTCHGRTTSPRDDLEAYWEGVREARIRAFESGWFGGQ
jgi:hypothetical protein